MPSSSTADLRPYLDRLAMHSVLGKAEREAILGLPVKQVQLRPNQDFVRVGEHVPCSCYVAEGVVGRFVAGRQGERQFTALHIPGDMPDLHSAIRPTGLGGLTTLCMTTILQVPHAPLLRLVADYPIIGEALWRDCLLDAAVLMDWLVNVGRREARSRLAHLFCELAVRYAHGRGHLDQYRFPMTQQQLADMLGLTSVHMNRTVRTLREEGLATFRGGLVSILEWQRLVEIGDFDPAYLLSDTSV